MKMLDVGIGSRELDEQLLVGVVVEKLGAVVAVS